MNKINTSFTWSAEPHYENILQTCLTAYAQCVAVNQQVVHSAHSIQQSSLCYTASQSDIYTWLHSKSVFIFRHELLMEFAHSVTDALNLVFLWQNCRPEVVCAIRLTETIARHYDNTSVLQHLLAVQPLACLANLLGLLESSLWQLNGGECIQGSINGGAAHTLQLIEDLSAPNCLKKDRCSTAASKAAFGLYRAECSHLGQNATNQGRLQQPRGKQRKAMLHHDNSSSITCWACSGDDVDV